MLLLLFSCWLDSQEFQLAVLLLNLFMLYRYVPRELDVSNLVKVSTLPPTYDLTVERDHKTGALIGFTEVCGCVCVYTFGCAWAQGYSSYIILHDSLQLGMSKCLRASVYVFRLCE